MTSKNARTTPQSRGSLFPRCCGSIRAWVRSPSLLGCRKGREGSGASTGCAFEIPARRKTASSCLIVGRRKTEGASGVDSSSGLLRMTGLRSDRNYPLAV